MGLFSKKEEPQKPMPKPIAGPAAPVAPGAPKPAPMPGTPAPAPAAPAFGAPKAPAAPAPAPGGFKPAPAPAAGPSFGGPKAPGAPAPMGGGFKPAGGPGFGGPAAPMVEEAKELVKIHPNIVIKIPMCAEGLKATKILTSMGVKTNVTLIFSATQALLAARAGATYVSPFVGRLDDIGQEGINLISEVSEIFSIHGIETEIISASIRNPIHVTASALAGAHIATVPYKIIEQMTKHPLTDAGIERFLKDWESVPKK